MSALDDARADIEREIAKHRRHIAEGTSLGGESAEWHETCVAALASAIVIIDVNARQASALDDARAALEYRNVDRNEELEVLDTALRDLIAEHERLTTQPSRYEVGMLLAKWDDPARPGGWNPGDEHHLAASVIDALRRYITPPTDDEREALLKVIDAAGERWRVLLSEHAHRSREARDACMAGACDGDVTLNGYSFMRHSPSRPEYIADAVISAGYRRRGPITDEVVAAALGAWDSYLGSGILGEDAMRAALEAADRQREGNR